MSAPINLEVGLSASESLAVRGGETGPFTVSGGGAKQQQTLLIIIGVAVVAAAFVLVAFFKRR